MLILNLIRINGMDVSEDPIIRANLWLWDLSKVISGVAFFLVAVLYAPPGIRSWNLTIVSVDPFYLLVPLSLFLICGGGLDLWQWYEGDEIL